MLDIYIALDPNNFVCFDLKLPSRKERIKITKIKKKITTEINLQRSFFENYHGNK